MTDRTDKTRAAFYLRVSTEGQTIENQRRDLARVAKARGLHVVAEYSETASAGAVRPIFDGMLRDAHKGKFAVLLIWALDRFGRSTLGNLTAVLTLDGLRVKVISYREEWLALEGPFRVPMLAIISYIAETERETLIARTRAGLARARESGVALGRRPRTVTEATMALARTRRAEGGTLRAIALELKIPRASLARALGRDADRGRARWTIHCSFPKCKASLYIVGGGRVARAFRAGWTFNPSVPTRCPKHSRRRKTAPLRLVKAG